MGFFNRKEEKVYILSEAMRLLKTKKYANYTTIPVGNGYKLVPIEKASQHIKTLKIGVNQDRRDNFLNEISGQGTYRNANTILDYNNYQSVKSCQGQRNCIGEVR